MKDSAERENTYELPVYPKRGITITKGKNATLWDDRGNEYIDCVAGIGVASLGHNNEYIVNAVCKQAKRLITCPEIFHNDVRAAYLEKLISVAPKGLTRAFLCNSGTESVETAIKFARYSTKKSEFISAMRGFHGRTMGSLSAMFTKKYREGFEPLLPGFHHVPFNNFDKLKAAVNGNVAGIILEVIQGEGGIICGGKDFFRNVRDLCSSEGILLIIDEVQTGFCRTGALFACSHFEVEPDILCLAKAIAGGVPMGATLCADSVSVPAGKHGSTFGGNPLACAAATASLEYMLEHKLDRAAAEKGAYLIDRLRKHSFKDVREIRGMGLMIGIDMKCETKPVIIRLMEKGVLVLPGGRSVIRILPPLTIKYEQLDRVVDALVEVLE